MDERTRARLEAINRDFYDAVALEFSATRDHAWPGWEDVLSELSEGTLRVLDVGCGNGRFATFLGDRWKGRLVYLGVDSNEVLLTHAREQPRTSEQIDFEQHELLSAGFRTDPPQGPFDLIVLFGVLHHIPSFAARSALLALLGARLADRGVLAVTLWRFAEDERLRKRLLPWEEYNARARRPVDADQLEPGDSLVRWGTETSTPRYCHFANETEAQHLIERTEETDANLRLVRRFRADGRSGDLNDYLLFRRADPGV